MRRLQAFVPLTILAALFLALTACSSHEPRTAEEMAKLLRERSTQYWKFRKDFKYEQAYNLEVPSYHKTATLAQYIELLSGGKTKWLQIDLVDVNIDHDKAVVTLKVRYRHVAPFFPAKGIVMLMSDQWRYIEDNWYHVPHTLRPLKVLPTTAS